MTNNDILRRLRYTFNWNDNEMASMLSLMGVKVTSGQVNHWLKKDNDENYEECTDYNFAALLNGFIEKKRGKKEGPRAEIEARLNNNIILTKIKIALGLKADDIVSMLASVDFTLSKPELSAFTRKVDHKHYRECKDQVLRNFLKAIEKRFFVARKEKAKVPKKVSNKSKPSYKKEKGDSVEGARPNASNIYHNPYANSPSSESSQKNSRSKLTLKKP